MQSNVCKIQQGSNDLELILKESEKVAIYNELDNKQTLQLRLLCEEIDGMLPEILGDFEGKLWIEYENGLCKINVSIEFSQFTAEKKEELLGIAKNKKNASAVGVTGKIRSFLEDVFLDEDTRKIMNSVPSSYYLTTGCGDYTYLWSLDEYKEQVKTEEDKREWDQLEKSVIASVADDVIVGIKGKRADIIVIKKFS